MLKDRLKKARKHAKLTQAQVAAAVKMTQPAYSDLETGGSSNTSFMVQLATVLDVNPNWLATGSGEMRPGAPEELPIYGSAERLSVTLKKVPLISWVQAGDWCDASDPYPIGDAEDWLACPFDHGENAYCLRVSGDSMLNDYSDGQIILVDPSVRPEHGDDVIARTPDGKASFKRLHITPEGMHLEATNPHWPNRVIQAPDGTVICGVVTASWQRRLRRK